MEFPSSTREYPLAEEDVFSSACIIGKDTSAAAVQVFICLYAFPLIWVSVIVSALQSISRCVERHSISLESLA